MTSEISRGSFSESTQTKWSLVDPKDEGRDVTEAIDKEEATRPVQVDAALGVRVKRQAITNEIQREWGTLNTFSCQKVSFFGMQQF